MKRDSKVIKCSGSVRRAPALFVGELSPGDAASREVLLQTQKKGKVTREAGVLGRYTAGCGHLRFYHILRALLSLRREKIKIETWISNS